MIFGKVAAAEKGREGRKSNRQQKFGFGKGESAELTMGAKWETSRDPPSAKKTVVLL